MANTFTFANLTLTDADIFGGINFTHDLNTGEEFTIGNTASASVKFVTDTQLPLYSKDAVNGTFTWTQDGVSRGRYYITEVTKASGKYEVTAYDAMILLDTSVSALSLTFPLSVGTAASAIATFIGCTTQGTINNSTMEAEDGTIEDTVTCRQLLGWVAEASGCSVKIDGSDHLCFMYYADSGITITASDYIEYGLNVADYTCAAIDNVTICDMAGMTAASAGSGTNSLFIQGNPFLYDATDTEAAVILGCVDSFIYAPFTCDMFEENGLEVGTMATFGSTATLVMHIESSESGAVASAVGSDTRAEFNKSIDIIVNEALAVANDAQQTAQATNLHFWYTASGDEAGAHIAEVDKPTFDADPQGGNVRIDSNSLDIRNGLDVLASFSATEAVMGSEDSSSISIGLEGIAAQKSDGTEYFEIGQSSASITQESNRSAVVATPGGQSGLSGTANLTEAPYASLYDVIATGAAIKFDITVSIKYWVTNITPQQYKTVSRTVSFSGSSWKKGTSHNESPSNRLVSYISYSSSGTCYVSLNKTWIDNNFYSSAHPWSVVDIRIRLRGNLTTPAPSYAFGVAIEATKPLSFGINEGTIPSSYGLALGKYNEDDTNDDYVLIAGNGTSDSSRSNALAVSWDGDIEIALDTTAASGTDHDIYDALVALGWDSDVIV